MLVRGALVWGRLAAGTSGLPLKTAGAGANPAYGRLGKSGMGWTADKLLKGDGVDADPVEIIPGSLTATCIVVANDAKAEVKAWATILKDAGYPVWICDGTADEIELQAGHDALASYERMVAIGPTFNLANPIIWTKSQTTFDCYGVLKPTGVCAFQIGALATCVRFLNIFIKGIDGVNKSPDGIQCINTSHPTIRLGEIKNCNRGIFFPQNGKEGGEIYFHYNHIGYCNYGILFEAPYDTFNDFMEGCQFQGGFIRECLYGIVARGVSDFGYVEGVIDNADVANSIDIDIGSKGWVFNTKFIRLEKTFYPPSTFLAMRNDYNTVISRYGDIHFFRQQRDYTNWTSSVSGSGVVSKGLEQCVLTTGATANSNAGCYRAVRNYGDDSTTFDAESILLCEFMPVNDVANAVWYLKIDDDVNAVPPNSKAFGFRLDNFALKGIIHNGTTLYTIDLATTLTHDVGYALACRFVAGLGIKWYVNGELKGEDINTAHLPSGSLTGVRLVNCVTNGASAANKEIRALAEYINNC